MPVHLQDQEFAEESDIRAKLKQIKRYATQVGLKINGAKKMRFYSLSQQQQLILYYIGFTCKLLAVVNF